MSIIHVRQIESKLKFLFSGLIDMDDYHQKPEKEKELAFLSRALAAFSILATSDATQEQAASSVTDGFHDNGIDAVYFNEQEKILYIIQTKWKQDGTGGIDRGDALKFITGIKNLIDIEFERFNEKVKKRSAEIENALYQVNTRIVIIISYTGQANLSKEVECDFNDLLKLINDTSEVMSLKVLKQADLYGFVASDMLGTPIKLDVALKDWGQQREPFSAYYGIVSASEVAGWSNKYYSKLVMPNIRSFLGETEINQSIVQTLLTDPEKFWYFNNGITALCGTIRRKALLGGNTRDSGIFECNDVRIVNGAQTVGAIANAYSKSPDQVDKAFVSIRFISLENCPEDFSLLVTRSTNTQNRIDSRDFVSLDTENQERIRTELQIEGVSYVYKTGENVRDNTKGFDFLEAIIAVACAHHELSYAIQAKSKVSLLYEDIEKAPYKALFNPSLSSIRLWKLVQIHRIIESILKADRVNRKGRESGLLVHGNRFLARQVFLHLDLKNLDDPVKDIQILLDQVNTTTVQMIDITARAIADKYPDSYIANLFKNTKKCQEIEKAINLIS